MTAPMLTPVKLVAVWQQPRYNVAAKRFNTTEVNTVNFSTANVTAAPHSTLLGLAALFTGLSPMLASASLPTSPVGWVSMGVGILGALFGVLGQNGTGATTDTASPSK